jgi:hypothetical protein
MSPGKAISLDLPGQSRTVTQKEEQRIIRPLLLKLNGFLTLKVD